MLTPQIAGVIAVGLGSGVLSGLLGVGGATVSTPGIRVMGATPLQAVGSTIPAVLPSAIVGAWRSARAGLVDWRVALTCGGAGSVAAVGGALLSDAIDPRILMILTAAVLLWSGYTVLTSGKAGVVSEELDPQSDAGVGPVAMQSDHRDPGGSLLLAEAPSVAPAVRAIVGRTPLIAAVGAAAGMVAGLLGVGGGVVMMPLFTGVLAIPVRRAVPTSLVAVAMFSVPALITHTLLGHMDWTIAIALIVGVIPGARLGAHFNRQASDDVLRRLFGLFLVVLALIYGFEEFGGILALVR